jgi:choline dehydrogenase-like flavoprotein
LKSFDFNDNSAVVVIGSGAGGGTIAHELCNRGIRVVLLEAGKYIRQDEFRDDEMFAYQQLSWLDKRIATGNWAAAKYAPDMPSWTAKTVGGTTVTWNGLSYRAQSHEFRARTLYGDIEGTNLLDWPIRLETLEPYYDLAEDKMGVTGSHGIPRHPVSNNYKVLFNGAKRLGYKNMSNGGVAINSQMRDNRPPCTQIGFCNQGCKIGAKWSTLVSEIPKAERTGKLDLRTECMALKIEHDEQGKIDGVLYIDGEGNRHLQKARLVCVAGNAIETPRLLLNSASPMFPDGLANSSGQVGRNYMRHTGALAFGVFDKPVHMYRGITTAGTVFDEMVHKPERGFAGGYLIEAVSLGLPYMALMADPSGWGQSFAGLLERYDHMAGVLMNGEDMPREQNHISLHATEKDQHGLPVPIVHVEEHNNELAMRAHFSKQASAIYDAAGADFSHLASTPSATHNMGTCRMSEKAKDGVVNQWGQAHDIENLFISDGSQFATSTCENPSLTIVALAIRQAERIAAQMSRREL